MAAGKLADKAFELHRSFGKGGNNSNIAAYTRSFAENICCRKRLWLDCIDLYNDDKLLAIVYQVGAYDL